MSEYLIKKATVAVSGEEKRASVTVSAQIPKEQRRAKLDYGTGNPAAAPDFRPMNPWGRPMPKPEREPHPPLHQVYVLDAKKGIIPVCPKMAKQFCEAIADTIRQNIRNDLEKRWSDPIVVKV